MQHVRRQQAAGERGIALILTLLLTVVGLSIVMAGTIVVEAFRRRTGTVFHQGVQADDFARAGLVEALSWFRRQTSQPVLAFAPQRDSGAVPPILDTDDPSVGLVREFEIGRGVWGRYELRKASVPGKRIPPVTDVSSQRGAPTPGTVWRLVSRGVVFRRRDPALPFDEPPNVVLGSAVLETEIQRMTLTPPVQAAVCLRRGDAGTVAAKGRVRGGVGAGLGFPQGTGSPVLSGEVFGSPPTAAVGAYDDSLPAVFGLSRGELRSLADDRIVDPAEFPAVIPNDAVLFCETSLTFDAAKPLKGSGIVYVEGDLTIAPGSNSFFSGFLYVTGNLTVAAPCLLRGTVVVLGGFRIEGSGDYAEIEYDDGLLNDLMVRVGRYRFSRAIHPAELVDTVRH